MTRRRVLVARLDNVGDVVLAGPAVRAVAASGADVTLLCGPRGRQGGALLPGVSDHLTFAAPWIDPEPEPVRPRAIDAFVAAVAARNIDDAIILTSFHQNPLPLALLLRLAGVRRIGAVSEDYPGSLLDVRHSVPDDLHEVERALALTRAMGYPLPAGDDGALAVHRHGRGVDVPGPYVVVHPGASVPTRAWAPARHRELASALVDDGWRVVVTGSAPEWSLTAYVADGNPGALDLGGATALPDLVEVLAGAHVVVTGNTGPAHLAAAVSTPVVSLYAPTVPAVRWRPWRVPHVLLGDQSIACRGCRARRCPLDDHPCLGSVAVDDVRAAIAALVPAGPDRGAELERLP